jgi:2-oxo-4-hydroxy-4-carboxy-5-ureidoimidazoline decarboxylase
LIELLPCSKSARQARSQACYAAAAIVGQSSKPLHTVLNELSADAARDALTRCCGAPRWVSTMLARRPFESTPALYEAAREIWHTLDRADYLAAFEHEPRMGENLSELAKRSPLAARVAAREQARLAQADPETLRSLREDNQRYFAHFGHNFIVSAQGKSAHEIQQLLRGRLTNDPARELELAAEEQSKITALRLARLA